MFYLRHGDIFSEEKKFVNGEIFICQIDGDYWSVWFHKYNRSHCHLRGCYKFANLYFIKFMSKKCVLC